MMRFDNSYLRDLPGSYLRLAPDVAPERRSFLALNLPLAAELGIDAVALTRQCGGVVFRGGTAGWGRAGGAGLCRAPVWRVFAATGRRAGASAGRGD